MFDISVVHASGGDDECSLAWSSKKRHHSFCALLIKASRAIANESNGKIGDAVDLHAFLHNLGPLLFPLQYLPVLTVETLQVPVEGVPTKTQRFLHRLRRLKHIQVADEHSSVVRKRKAH